MSRVKILQIYCNTAFFFAYAENSLISDRNTASTVFASDANVDWKKTTALTYLYHFRWQSLGSLPSKWGHRPERKKGQVRSKINKQLYQWGKKKAAPVQDGFFLSLSSDSRSTRIPPPSSTSRMTNAVRFFDLLNPVISFAVKKIPSTCLILRRSRITVKKITSAFTA